MIRALILSLVALSATPALARPRVVTLPARVLKTPETRICLPREYSQTVGRDREQPRTLCNTVADWTAHGVTVVGR